MYLKPPGIVSIDTAKTGKKQKKCLVLIRFCCLGLPDLWGVQFTLLPSHGMTEVKLIHATMPTHNDNIQQKYNLINK